MGLSLPPSVRYMIVCEEVRKDDPGPGRVTVVGVSAHVRWPAGATKPVRLQKLAVLLVLTDGRGSGTGRILCSNEATELPAFRSPPRPISFEGKDPVGVYGFPFTLLDCHFPAPGMYTVQFLFNNVPIHEQLMTVW